MFFVNLLRLGSNIQYLSNMKFGILEVKYSFEPLPSSPVSDNASLYRALITDTEEITLQIDSHPVTIPPFSILYISAETVISFGAGHDCHFYFLYFSEVFYRRTSFDEDLLKSEFTFNAARGFSIVTIEPELQPYFISQVRFLHEIYTTRNLVVFNDLLHSVIKQLLLVGTLMGTKDESMNDYVDLDHEIVRSFRLLVEEYLSTEKSVAFYAEKLGVSSRRLSHACKTVLETTPKQFISRCIIKEAKRRLLYTSESVREIAWKLGYEEENNFSAFFMKEAKLSPSTYRKAYHKGT